MSNDSTNIHELPTNPTGGGSIGGNISLAATESAPPAQQQQQQQSQMSLDQTTINQIVSGLQQASSAGMTQLQSRDIPTSTEQLMQDPQIQPNYIPPANNRDYIKEQEDTDDIIQNYSKRTENESNLDRLYEDIQTPLLIAILFFLFQLPIFRKNLYKYGPSLFSNDGNINIYGYIFTSGLFGIVYYILSKSVGYFNNFG